METRFTLIPLDEFKNRVLVTDEVVQFTHVDPYNHLNVNRYVEFIVNHRVQAPKELLSCFTEDVLSSLGIGFAVANLNARFLAPATIGEKLEIASFVSSHDTAGFDIVALVLGKQSRKLKTLFRIRFAAIEVRTGKPATMPAALPSRATSNPMGSIPTLHDYLETTKIDPGLLLTES